jgi:hypothetical protein
MEPSARTDQAVSANQVLLMVKGHDHLDPGPGRVLDDVGQVRGAEHRRLIHDGQVTRAEADRPERATAPGEGG